MRLATIPSKSSCWAALSMSRPLPSIESTLDITGVVVRDQPLEPVLPAGERLGPEIPTR